MPLPKKVLGALATAIVAASSGCCTPRAAESHAVNLHAQNRDWWCWAATTQMVSEYRGHRVEQCDSASFVHGTPPACCTGCTGSCPCWGSGWGATIADIQNNWTHWGFTYTYVPSSLAWDDVKKTLSKQPRCNSSPLYAVINSHVVIVTGYLELKLAAMNLRLLYYNDPWPPDCSAGASGACQPVAGGAAKVSTYDAFAPAWWATFHTFQKS